MKKFLIATTAVALMCGVASAQTSRTTGTAKSATGHVQKKKHMSSYGMSKRSTVGMSRRPMDKAQPGGLAGSGGPNAGNLGGAAPGASAGGGNGGGR